MNKKHIAQSFGKASQTYDQEAPVQKWTAERLCDDVSALNLSGEMDCLEIGCGTGFLTEKMIDLLPGANWTISDLSEDMLAQCKNRIGDVGKFVIMDGEHPNGSTQYDLIVSSLAVQWFVDLELGLKQLFDLLKPGGRLLVTTLGKDSFSQWRKNLLSLGLPVGLHSYPSLEDIQSFHVENGDIQVRSISHLQPYENGLSFLRALKAIGAQKPNSDYEPMAIHDMRKAVRNLEREVGCKMTYEIFFIEYKKAD